MVGKYGEFYAAQKWGFPKAVPSEHAPSPQQFMPEHINDPSFYEKGWHKEELGDGFYWVTSPSGYEAAFMLTR
ncbi:hypothetical protein [Micromonospora sp. NPDC050276]|uniref:hypothetical protein n=1 Tax=Micromonospora sp. NPDC050276 TaxID=3364278 RepID=UPI0037A3814F